MRSLNLKLSIVFLSALGTTSLGFAATATTNLGVTATIAGACSISVTTALAFGSYSSAAQLDGTGTISATCTVGTPYTISMGPGLGAGATTTVRKMTSPTTTSTLNYSLYRDAGRTLNWGNTIGTDTLAGVGVGVAAPITVYGRIPSGQTSAAAATDYADTVLVTLTY